MCSILGAAAPSLTKKRGAARQVVGAGSAPASQAAENPEDSGVSAEQARAVCWEEPFFFLPLWTLLGRLSRKSRACHCGHTMT